VSEPDAGQAGPRRRLAALDLPAYRALIGREIGASGWHRIDQAMIDAFAELTFDQQFIHVDPVRAGATPLGGTVAHGFLALSLLSHFAHQVVPPVAGSVMSVNYGIEKLRFLAPVRAGARVRGCFKVLDLRERRPGEWLLVLDVRVEIEGGDKPALIAEWLGLHVIS
jgi:acyl dehydratase